MFKQPSRTASHKVLEAVESIHITGNSPQTTTIYTDSRITLESLLNAKNHACLIAEIRKRVATLASLEWKIELRILVGQGPRRNPWK
jgi:hypothetical protein